MRPTSNRTATARRSAPTTAPAAVSSFLVRHCRWELMAQPKRPLTRQ